MKQHQGLHRVRNLILILLLAGLCITGVELAVCRVKDPALYTSVTAPVVQLWRDAREQFQTTLDQTANAAEATFVELESDLDQMLHPPVPETPEPTETLSEEESQVAGAPAIHSTLVPAPYTVTQLVTEETQEFLLGGNCKLPYFNQADDAWRDKPFGVDRIGGYGCGPTALAMAVSGLTDREIDPAEMAAMTAAAGFAAPHSGSYLSIVEGTAAAFDLDCVSLADTDAATLCTLLTSSGGVMVALMGPGHFTKGGHFILFHGVTLGGEVLVADPYSRENSLSTWDPALLVEELSASRSDGAPLWLLTRPLSLSGSDAPDEAA